MLLINLFQEVINSPMITDWLQGIGTILGVPAAIAAFIMLFVRDKLKQKQIDKLIIVADELKKQTNELSLQTQHMAEYNQILKDILNYQIKYQEGNIENQTEIVELKKKELKSRYKPIFKWDGGQSSAKLISIKVKNVGEVAKILELKEIGEGKLKFVTQRGVEVPKNNYFQLEAEYLGPDSVHNIDNLIEILFEDAVGNRYKQKFMVRGGNAKVLPIEEIN